MYRKDVVICWSSTVNLTIAHIPFFFCAMCGYVGRLQLGPDRKILAFVDIDLVFCVPSNRAT
jgi:hypothetical protein